MSKPTRASMARLSLLGIFYTSVAAANAWEATPAMAPAGSGEIPAVHLTSDGTLGQPQDFTDSLKPKGFRIVQGAEAQPRRVASPVTDEKLFGVPRGCNGPVHALTTDTSGRVYLGGDFTVCDDVRASRIAVYDPLTQRFEALGEGVANGLNGAVLSIAVDGDDGIYAGGFFSEAGGSPARGVAHWNGTFWSSIGTGSANGVGGEQPFVRALSFTGDGLYAGGDFTLAGGQPANRVAYWDGIRWSALQAGTGNGVTGGAGAFVNTLAFAGGSLYVGGEFAQAGAQPANRIARWSGAGWFSLGEGIRNGFNSRVFAIVVEDGIVYAGGPFNQAGGVPANGVAKWDGISWSPLGGGVRTENGGGSVRALAHFGGHLYACGFFTRANGLPANWIARWNGATWTALGSGGENGVNFDSFALASSPSGLYVGGGFSLAGGQLANRIARWDGSRWFPLGFDVGTGLNFAAYALALVNGDLIAGGGFSRAGSELVNYIARWNGSRWSSLGSGVNGAVSAIALFDGDLYAAGGFTRAGNVSANRIARWDGKAWSTLGVGPNNGVTGGSDAFVYALAVHDGALIVGGVFDGGGGQPARNIARWDGASWSSLGTGAANGVTGNSEFTGVYALASEGEELAVGGFFVQAGAVPAMNVVRWRSDQGWSSLGNGMSNGVDFAVFALAHSPSGLYLGGSFSNAGGSPANGVALWNGSSWSSLGVGVGGESAYVRTLAAVGPTLFVGGPFSAAGGAPANGLARWDGSSWLGLAIEAPPQDVFTLVSDGSSLFAGGSGLTQSPLAELQSRAVGGADADGPARFAQVDRSGRRTIFASRAANLLEGGDAFSDIYLRDTQTGQIRQISQATPTAKGLPREEFFNPSIAPSGNTVAYSGTSGQVFANFSGLGRTASTSRGGTPGNGESGRPMTPGSGSTVLYDSTSTNLLDTPDGNGPTRDILAKDLNTGAVSLITVGPTGQPANGDSFGPWATDDGRTVAFWSLATNLSDEAVNSTDAAKMGTIKQALVSTVQGLGRSAIIVSRNPSSNELGNGDSINVRLTPDGRFGVFESLASNLVDDDTNGVSDIFRFEVEPVGGRLRLVNLERVSLSRYGFQGNGPSFNPSISDDGQFITFQTDATNLIELDRNDASDILVKWMVTKEVVRLSRTVDGEQPNGDSIEPMISGDGSTIVFGSGASNLTENDDNGVDDIFAVRIRESGGQAIVGGITNYSYTYWNPNEPGWGYNLQHQGDLLYGTWYTYADDGQVMFLTVEATAQSSSSFAGPVFRIAGTPFNQINGQAFTSVTQVGTAQMNFAADGGLTLSYTVNGVPQVKALEKFIFGSTAPVCVGTTEPRTTATNYSDLWWNAAEPGWGLTLAHQGDTVFALWYTYGTGGRDQWISASSLVRQSDGSFAGALQRPQSGTPLAQISGPATSFPVPGVGNATLRFTNGEAGSFSYTLDGVSQTKAIQRFVVVGEGQLKPVCAE